MRDEVDDSATVAILIVVPIKRGKNMVVKMQWLRHQFVMYGKNFLLSTLLLFVETRKSVHGTQMPPPIVFISPAIKHLVYNK